MYAIEASEMASHAEMIVAKNGLSNVVQVINGKVEQIQLPVEQVDVIVSEWMGIFLLFVRASKIIIIHLKTQIDCFNSSTGWKTIIREQIIINISFLGIDARIRHFCPR